MTSQAPCWKGESEYTENLSLAKVRSFSNYLAWSAECRVHTASKLAWEELKSYKDKLLIE
jgi:hypothetical protein